MTDSPPLIKLRVLAGANAGAELTLRAGSYSIGTHIESDIVIRDWPHFDSTLDLQPDGASVQGRATNGQALSLNLAPLMPVAIGAVVLVMALVTAEWPTDTELLRIMADRAAPAPAEVVPAPALPSTQVQAAGAESGFGPRRWRWLALWGASVIVMGLSVAVAAAVGRMGPEALQQQAPEARESAARRIGRALLDPSTLPEISLVAQDGHLSLRGWVRDASQAELLKHTFANDTEVRHAYAVVQNVQALISDRVAENDTQVLYRGQGAFAVVGALRRPEKARQTIDALRTELGSSVASIALEAAAIPTLSTDGRTRSVIYLPDGQIITTADGAKRRFSTKESVK